MPFRRILLRLSTKSESGSGIDIPYGIFAILEVLIDRKMK